MRSTPPGSRTARVAACLLLTAIALDLAADTRCDVARPLGSAPAVRAHQPGQPGDGEPCAPVCVPDCFCCSRSLVAGSGIEPPAPVLLSTLDLPAMERWSGGFRPVVDHPPLRLA
jgi:hypothetical protein